ncbi:MAG: peptidylprolyl isomerase [Candidatus Zixiibacteriota bacterium]|nr:MAG: peptidylprolyl isomerase [candidate division Zixibacteria bacterium]
MLKMLPIIMAVLILILSCGESEVDKDDPRYYDDRVIAKLGDHILTLGEVHKKFRDTEFDSTLHEYDKKKSYVEEEIERFLVIDGAKAAGLSYEPDSATIQSYLFQELYKRDAGVKSEVSDSDVRRHFKRYGGEIQFGPLVVEDSALIDTLYRMLENGADWDSLVLEHSVIRLGKKRGGSLGYVPFGQYDEEIQGKAYDLEFGEYTEPFRTRFGWCIVKLFDRIKHSEEDLEENWDVYKRVTTNYSEILQTDEYKKRLLDDYNYRINWQDIDMMARISDSVKNTGNLPVDMPGSAYLERSVFTPGQLSLYLAEFKAGGITIEQYLDLMESYNPYRTPRLRDRFEMESVLKGVATRRIMVNRALELGYDTLQTFREALEYYEENWLIQEFYKQLYAQMDTVTEEDIRKYYNGHPEDCYRPDQVRVSAISLKTEDEAIEALEKLKMGANFSAMAKKYSRDKKSASEGGDLNFFTEKRFTEIYDAARDLEAGDIGGPVEMYGNYWVFRVTQRLTRELRPYHLVRSNIRSRILLNRRNQAVRSWIDENKKNTDYFLDLGLLKNDLGITAKDEMRAGAEEEIE